MNLSLTTSPNSISLRSFCFALVGRSNYFDMYGVLTLSDVTSSNEWFRFWSADASSSQILKIFSYPGEAVPKGRGKLVYLGSSRAARRRRAVPSIRVAHHTSVTTVPAAPPTAVAGGDTRSRHAVLFIRSLSKTLGISLSVLYDLSEADESDVDLSNGFLSVQCRVIVNGIIPQESIESENQEEEVQNLNPQDHHKDAEGRQGKRRSTHRNSGRIHSSEDYQTVLCRECNHHDGRRLFRTSIWKVRCTPTTSRNHMQ
ncbi:hypothetical protein IV203_006107 [Nitzschia inconspicua]|uniref:Uncharacterized protein n=1 Tax=Nitzschia inconspicua TaxID=303405 RepID=A0A9K3PH02_9STRA|nr:hypothetical protein IV203_006107 [Nitzschia inconspicua]